MPSHTKVLQGDARHDRVIAVIRLVLAMLALLVTYYDDVQDVRHGAAIDVVLALYIVYSTVLVILVRYRPFLSSVTAYWIDVGWYMVLLGVGGGANNVFFFFLLICLSILVASFQDGFRAGCRITCISVVLFTLAGLGMGHAEPGFALNHFLLWPVGLGVFGIMVAYWGGSELTFKRRLALLKDISTLANPRFGIDRTLGVFLERLRVFYDADICLLIMGDQTTDECSLRRADRHNPQAAERAESIPEGMLALLALPADQALIFHDSPRCWQRWSPRAGVHAYDVTTGKGVTLPSQTTGILDAASCITVPLHFHGKMIGRLYLTAPRRHTFGVSDVHFLLQGLDHTMPIIDNIRLVDRLASDAAETERQRIAHDIHDNIIQPNVALQLGLMAVLRRCADGKTDVRNDLEQLLAQVNAELVDMRRYVRGLSQGRRYKDSLLPAVQRFAQKFTAATGIVVHVETTADVCINDRLAAEAFQMVAEGLSNVRRHTDSTWVTMSLACCNGSFLLRIENDDAAGTAVLPFSPRSITERAVALGGQIHVRRTEDARVVVIVDIPL